MRRPAAGGGWHAIGYTVRKTISAGPIALWRSMWSRNSCRTCALGMGGQKGGMVNEAGHFPEFCKKSIQAAAADIQPAISAESVAAPFAYMEGMTPRQLEAMGRIPVPLVAEPGADRYRLATWEEAFTRLSAKLSATAKSEAFFYVSGRSSNEAGFLLQLFARAWGTNTINNCSFYCHQASGVGLGSMFGSGAGTLRLEDLEACDTMFLIGGNPASNHPRFMRTLMELRRRGGHIVVINPLREVGLERFKVPSDPRSLLLGSEIADLYVQPHCGGDLALLLDIARRVVARGAHDAAWLAAHTEGWPELEVQLRGQDGVALARAHGVAEAVVEQVVDAYVRSKASVFTWVMGITHHRHGTDSVRAIANLALLRGMIGRPGAGLLPLRGHSNIQGLGTVGVMPKLKPEIAGAIERRFGISIPEAAGLDTLKSLEAAAAGRMRVAWALGGNLYGASPDSAWAQRALGAIDQLVYLNTTLNTGHVHGRGKETWILPVRARDEEQEATTQESMFSFVRLSDGGRERIAGARSEASIIGEIAARVPSSGAIDWRALAAHEALRQAMAETIPGLAGMKDIGAAKSEFHIPGRAVTTPRFATVSGKARIFAVSPPAAQVLASDQLRVMTIRSEGQFNSVVYEDHDRYRGTERRDVILMAQADIVRLGLRHDQRVDLSSSVGVWAGVRVRAIDITPGNAALYYPEANILVPRDPDPESGTPAFKSVVVRIAPAA